MTLEARALVWLAVQAREVQSGSAQNPYSSLSPNLGNATCILNFFNILYDLPVSGLELPTMKTIIVNLLLYEFGV